MRGRRTYRYAGRRSAEVRYPNRFGLQLGVCALLFLLLFGIRQIESEPVQAVVGTLRDTATTEIELDESLGKLSYVSSMIPESVQVFWNDTVKRDRICAPFADGTLLLEKDGCAVFEGTGKVLTGAEGEAIAVEQGDYGGYAVTLIYTNGLSCRIEPLQGVTIAQGDRVESGQELGSAFPCGESARVCLFVQKGGKSIPASEWLS